MSTAISLSDFGAALAALGALSTASFGILDASKAFHGGVSNLGLPQLTKALAPFREALENCLSSDWKSLVRANWIAGVSKDTQKARIQSLVRLGLRDNAVAGIATRCGVSPDALRMAAQRYARGEKMRGADIAVLGRVDAIVDALLDAAFEAADQRYRNQCRLLAGLMAVTLSLIGGLWFWPDPVSQPSVWSCLAVGILAVPVAPIAKDMSSGLATAIQALKASKA